MKVYRTLGGLRRCGGGAARAVAIGVFDGMHLGHQAIVSEARRASLADGLRTMVFTFEPTPKEYFSPATAPPRLTRFRERLEQVQRLGVEEMLCPRFGLVRATLAAEFVEAWLAKGIGARHVVVGEDFRFGAKRAGTVDLLRSCGRRFGFEVRVVPPVFERGERVSSTAIRTALAAGDLVAARAMLGRDYSISGRVVRGLGLGRKLGFPTANVNLQRLQAPVDGIFAARVTGLGGEILPGVASVGTRPTIGGGRALLEVMLFDFDAEIYGQYITVHFVKRLRAEEHFADLATMQAQMHADVAAARAALTD